MTNSEIEKLSAQIHKVYCRYHVEVRGSEYWTKGDYELLDEATKDADRYMAKFITEVLAKQREELESEFIKGLSWAIQYKKKPETDYVLKNLLTKYKGE